MPAVALGTDAFRHGPQEAVTSGIRVAIWIDDHAREADYAVARDRRSLGAVVMVVGSALPVDSESSMHFHSGVAQQSWMT